MNLKFYAYNESSIPELANRIPGSIIYTEQGNQYLVKPDKELLQVTTIECGFVDLTDLLTKNPARENKIYLLDSGKMYFYKNSEYKELTQDKEILGGYSNLTDLVTKNPAKLNTLYFTDNDKIYFYTGDAYLDVSIGKNVYGGFNNKVALVAENPAQENTLYFTKEGGIYIYSSSDYILISRDLDRNKKERIIYSANGDIEKLEYSIDNFATILIEKTYEYNPIDETIISETVKDYENGKQTVNSFSYGTDGNISEISTTVTNL